MNCPSPQEPSNNELALAHQELARQRTALDAARAQIAELTTDLDATNRGVVALLAELEAAHKAEAKALADREVMADRERMARDLHDEVIGRVFAAGLGLQGVVGLVDDPRAAQRVEEVITELDATIRGLRTAIFCLQQPQQATSLRAQLRDLIRQAEGILGFSPTTTLRGPIDAAVPDHVAADLLAVTREALSNIARHAHATSAEITLRVGDELVLVAKDNGRGVGSTTRASGLANMRHRAETYGGSFHATGEPGTGTLLEWRVPLPRRYEPRPASETNEGP